MHDAITKLADVFVQFPGIGKRQAKRFVYFLLAQDAPFREELAKLIRELQNDIASCVECRRFFVGRKTQSDVCDICSDPAREKTALMIVEKDVDLENIESSGAYAGLYFVLGGTIPVLDEAPEKRIRVEELQERIKSNVPKEIILATSAHPEGENTAEYVRKLLVPLQEEHSFDVSLLGRGLSTGTELEYSDADTIRNAFENRHPTR